MSLRTAVAMLALAVPLAIPLALPLARPLGAQVVRGTVTMPDGATRAAGVIVIAVRDSSQPARTLTNQRGAFTLRLDAAGRYSIRVLRIGFRPTDGPTVTVATSDTISVQVTITDVAVSLQAVSVKGDDVCRTRPDSGALVARAWEEARKAIMSSQLAAADAPLVADWIEYNRTLDPSGRIVRGLRVKSTTNPTTHAFKSAPAESLAARGYVVAEGGETTYHAPDGDVLLSDSFASTHCFQIVPSARGADTLVGVGFRPAKDQKDIRDIEGTFWLDRRSAELRWMDYTYTNMPAIAEKASPGGRVEFLRAGTSGWLIGRWSIRMPEIGRAPIGNDPGVRRVVRPTAVGSLRAIQVTGGQVTKVSRGDTVVYQAAGARLDVQVVARDQSVNPARAIVELVGTDYVATADASGRARITPVLEGRYEARVRTPLMDTLHVTPVMREVDVTVRSHTDSVRLPSADEILTAVCRDSIHAGESLVRGLVRDSLGNPLAGVAVTFTWLGRVKVGVENNADRVSFTEQSVGSMTDDAGRYKVCGVPRDVLLIARVRMDKVSDARRLTLDADQAFGAVDLVPHRVAATTDLLLPKANRAMVEFTVTDDDGALVPGTTLDVETPDGLARTFNTGTTGRVLLADAAPGRLTVRARKIGFRPGQIVVSIAPGRNTIPIIVSSAGFPTLDTVRIVGDERKRNDRFDDFETRRLNGAATRSITRAEIEKRNPPDAWHMLTNLSSIAISQIGGDVRATPTRSIQVSLLNNRPCFLKVAVDGVLWQDDPPNLANLPPPDAIHGIEVFSGPASIPLQYGGTGRDKWCGLIAVWTR